ncbi:unnamed protein product, partial [Amoebophrya sp. A120]
MIGRVGRVIRDGSYTNRRMFEHQAVSTFLDLQPIEFCVVAFPTGIKFSKLLDRSSSPAHLPPGVPGNQQQGTSTSKVSGTTAREGTRDKNSANSKQEQSESIKKSPAHADLLRFQVESKSIFSLSRYEASILLNQAVAKTKRKLDLEPAQLLDQICENSPDLVPPPASSSKRATSSSSGRNKKRGNKKG